MPTVLKMAIAAVVQGATEFLPVSSSGHLTIIQEVVGIKENRVLFDVFLHVGTLIAIFAVFGKDVLALFSSGKSWIPYLIVASLPAAAVGLTLHSCIAPLFDSVQAVGLLLIGNGLILALGSVARKRKDTPSEVGMKGAFFVGLAQSVAILPGISRSGSTVCSGLVMGWERESAVRFSFLLAVPAVIGATVFELAKSGSALPSEDILAVAFSGVLISAAVGYIALRLLLKVVKKGKLWFFAGYCFVLGVVLAVYCLTE